MSTIYTTYKTSKQHREAREYYDLCEQAADLEIPTSLDDPLSPPTVAALREAVRDALEGR